MMNMMNMMKQAQNIQKKLVDAQNELANNGNIEPFLKEYFSMYDFSE